MRDPLALAADAAVLLGLAPRDVEARAEPVFSWVEYASLDEMRAVVAEHRRRRRPEAGLVEVPDEWMRRARLRFVLGLGERRRLESGEEYVWLRGCLTPDPLLRRCRCVEDALCDVAEGVLVVDEGVLGEVRRRARLAHERLRRRVEGRVVPRKSWPVSAGSARSSRLRPVVEPLPSQVAGEVVAPARASSSGAGSRVARGSIAGTREFDRRFQELTGRPVTIAPDLAALERRKLGRVF